MERNTEKEYIIIVLEVNTKGSGWVIKNMDMAAYSIQQGINTKVIGEMDNVVNKECIIMQMEMFIKEDG